MQPVHSANTMIGGDSSGPAPLHKHSSSSKPKPLSSDDEAEAFQGGDEEALLFELQKLQRKEQRGRVRIAELRTSLNEALKENEDLLRDMENMIQKYEELESKHTKLVKQHSAATNSSLPSSSSLNEEILAKRLQMAQHQTQVWKERAHQMKSHKKEFRKRCKYLESIMSGCASCRLLFTSNSPILMDTPPPDSHSHYSRSRFSQQTSSHPSSHTNTNNTSRHSNNSSSHPSHDSAPSQVSYPTSVSEDDCSEVDDAQPRARPMSRASSRASTAPPVPPPLQSDPTPPADRRPAAGGHSAMDRLVAMAKHRNNSLRQVLIADRPPAEEERSVADSYVQAKELMEQRRRKRRSTLAAAATQRERNVYNDDDPSQAGEESSEQGSVYDGSTVTSDSHMRRSVYKDSIHLVLVPDEENASQQVLKIQGDHGSIVLMGGSQSGSRRPAETGA